MNLLKRINKRRIWCFIQARLASFITVVIFVACQGGTGGENSVTPGPDHALSSTPGQRYMLTVDPYGEGMGTVTSDGEGIDCGAHCSGTFDEGSSVVLIATPGENSSFGGWSGGGCNGTGTCRVTMDEAVSVTAYFTVAGAWSSTTGSPLKFNSSGHEKPGAMDLFHNICDAGYDGSNGMAVDPVFSNPVDWDYTLALGSLSINKGGISPASMMDTPE